MCLTLVKNDEKCWDEESATYFYNNSDRFSCPGIEEHSLNEIKESLEGNRRVNNETVKEFFDIKVDGHAVGEFWTSNSSCNLEIEISLRIFDNYRGKAYAGKAITYYINNYLDKDEHNYVIATVKNNNPDFNVLKKILESQRFQIIRGGEVNSTTWCYSINRS